MYTSGMSIENGGNEAPKILSLEEARKRLNLLKQEKEAQRFALLLNDLGMTTERLFEIMQGLQSEIQAAIEERKDFFPVDVANKIGDIFRSTGQYQDGAAIRLGETQSALSEALSLYLDALKRIKVSE